MITENILNIYTDCSEFKDEYGIGIFFIDGEKEKRFQLKTNISQLNSVYNLNEKVTTHIVETYSIIKAIDSINIEKTYDKIVIYTDSEVSYNKLNKQIQNKKKDILYNIVIKECLEKIKKYNIEIRWIKAHCGIYGNTISDYLAKNAIKNKKSKIGVIYNDNNKFIKLRGLKYSLNHYKNIV